MDDPPTASPLVDEDGTEIFGPAPTSARMRWSCQRVIRPGCPHISATGQMRRCVNNSLRYLGADRYRWTFVTPGILRNGREDG